MGVSVTFDINAWRVSFPEFASVDTNLVLSYFTRATLLHANNGSGPINDATQQQMFLGLVTAHICQLNAPTVGKPSQVGSPQLVGGITNATEGSVTVAVQNNYPPGTPQWWQQTKYGSEYFVATLSYRLFRYRPGWPRPVDPFLYYGGINNGDGGILA